MSKILKVSGTHRATVTDYEHGILENLQAIEGTDTDPATILARAREEAEVKVREAYAEGMRRGEEAGRKQFEESIGEVIEMLKLSSEALVTTRDAFLESTTSELVRLSGQIAAKILEREASVSPEVLKTACRQVLEALIDQESIRLRVHPSNIDVLQEHQLDVLESIVGIENFQVVGDDSLALGECVGESNELVADGGWEAQIARILQQAMEDD